MFSPNYNPLQIGLRRDFGGDFQGRYLPVGNQPKTMPATQKPNSGPMPAQQAPGPLGTLGAEAVRSTGTGPFDSTYRQNLASYAGGLFQRPGGYLGINPTGNDFGGNSGGGNAPALGAPNSLLQLGLGGQSFQVGNPQPAQQPKKRNVQDYWRDPSDRYRRWMQW